MNLNDALPNTDGITFVVNGKQYSYRLQAFNKLSYSNIESIAKYIAKDSQTYSNIQRFDYNLNGVVDEDDLVIALSYFQSNPKNWFWKHNQEIFDSISKSIRSCINCGMDNIYLRCPTNMKDIDFTYAYQVSSRFFDDDDDSTFEGWSIGAPVQVLPIEYLEQFAEYEEFQEISDNLEGAEYVAWIPEYYTNGRGFGNYQLIDIDNPDSSFEFLTGFFWYGLDDEGNIVYDWIHI